MSFSDIWIEGNISDTDGIIISLDTDGIGNLTAVLSSYTLSLVNGPNAFDIPATARGVIIEFGAACNTTKLISGVAVASNVAPQNKGAFFIIFGAGNTVLAGLVINSAGNDAGTTRILFF